MIRGPAIFFDLDDTIIHEHATNEAVMVEVVRWLLPGENYPPAAIVAAVRTAAQALWQRSGEIDYARRIGTSSIEGLYGDFGGDDPHLHALQAYIAREHYRERAWREALRTLGHDDAGGLALDLAGAYAEERRSRHVPFPDAGPALEWLASRARLALITNGAPRIQRAKLAGSGFAAFFDPIVISGDLGVGKPDPVIFHHALELAGATAAEAVMVGDSLPNDVVGAQSVDIRVVWLNRDGEALPPDVRPYQIAADLRQIRLE